MKKIVSLMLCVILVAMSISTSFASAPDDNVIFTLAGYGIISADAPNDGQVSRGEFAKIVANLLGYQQESGVAAKTSYLDVPESYEYAADISLLTQMGILNGVSDTMFAPNDFLTYEQAVKVMVVITGYGKMAQNNGGWPGGYITMASRNGMLGGVNLENPFSRMSLYRLIYNTLEVHLIDEVLSTGLNSELIKTDDTLKNQLANKTSSKIFKHNGVIVANSFTYTTSPYSDLYDDEVVIEDRTASNTFIFKIGNTNAFDLVGYNVDFYFRELDGAYELLSVKPSVNNEVIKVSAQDLNPKNGNSISYVNDKNKVERISLDANIKVAYNGSRVVSPAENIFNIADGFVTFINNDDDASFDTALIWEYENAIAKSFDKNRLDFLTEAKYGNLTSLYVDPENKDVKMVVRDKNLNAVDGFDTPHTVSICANRDFTRYYIVVCDETIEGAFESRSDDGVTVGAKEYTLASSFAGEVVLGQNYFMYLDFEGKIAFAEEKDAINYAYVMNYASKTALSTKVSAKLILPGKVDDGVVINEEDTTDTSRVPFLILQNSGVQVFDFAKTVRCQGSKYSGDRLLTLLGQEGMDVISYELNDDGEICEITPLEKHGGDIEDRYEYNVYDRVFGGKTVDQTSGFAINSSTVVACVPADDRNNVLTNASDEDLGIKVNITVANNDVGYRVEGYDFDESTKKVRFLLAFANMDAAYVPTIDAFGSRASMVTSVKHVLNPQSGEMEMQIGVLNGAEEKLLRPIAISAENRRIENLRKGDLIVYKTNSNDLIGNVLIVQHIPSLNEEFVLESTSNSIKRTYGRVGYVNYDEVDTYNKELITKLEVYVGASAYPVNYSIRQTNTPPIYIYNTQEQTVSFASLSEIRPQSDKLFIFERKGDGEVRAIVLVR